MKLLPDIDVSGKRVFLRADLDVDAVNIANPKSEIRNSKLSEEAVRLQNLRPTVEYLISHNAKQIIIAGHIGRPKQLTVDSSQLTESSIKSKFYDEKLSTQKLLSILEKILGQKITFQEDVIARSGATKQSKNEEIATSLDNLGTRNDGEGARVILLENLRFWDGEEKNDPEFAKQLAQLADVYVNDAFGVCHRVHASVVGVPEILPHSAGLHLEEEIDTLTKLIKDSKRPMVAIIGGAKLETKIPVIGVMTKVADFVLVGGLIAKEFKVESLKDMFRSAKLKVYGKNVVVAKLTEETKDISEDSIEKFKEVIKGAKTVVWNGPVGYFEGGFDRGTLAIARAVIDSGAYSVIGGGETTEFLGGKGLLDKFSFVSSGGGAMLEFLGGKELPGIKALV